MVQIPSPLLNKKENPVHTRNIAIIETQIYNTIISCLRSDPEHQPPGRLQMQI